MADLSEFLTPDVIQNIDVHGVVGEATVEAIWEAWYDKFGLDTDNAQGSFRAQFHLFFLFNQPSPGLDTGLTVARVGGRRITLGDLRTDEFSTERLRAFTRGSRNLIESERILNKAELRTRFIKFAVRRGVPAHLFRAAFDNCEFYESSTPQERDYARLRKANATRGTSNVDHMVSGASANDDDGHDSGLL
jgi:hypothetical protein